MDPIAALRASVQAMRRTLAILRTCLLEGWTVLLIAYEVNPRDHLLNSVCLIGVENDALNTEKYGNYEENLRNNAGIL